MNITINPFQQIYRSDDTQTETNFVELFSDEVLQTAIHPVFQGGNVVLSGTQGCGKTMILSLLKPEIRIAYFERQRSFPVNEQMRDFISGGVNLTRSHITDIVQVTLHQGEEADEREMPYYFADFFNYWVVGDLLNTVLTISLHPDVFGALVNWSRIGGFVKSIVKQDCWFGSLEQAKTIEQLTDGIAKRVGLYRRWVNGNLADDRPPEAIRRTKTNIGEPIARTAECLRQSGVISETVPVLIRVDQIEEMHRAFTERQRRLLLAFRKMINRLFAARDSRVHYRAGTRRYGWSTPEFLNVWGSEARLENRRDYSLIDMDEELFSFGESKNSVFERFATDAFAKRVAFYFRAEAIETKPQIAKTIFGRHPVAEERLAQLNRAPEDSQIDRALGLDLANDGGIWTDDWRIFLRKLYRSGHAGMLDAVLAAAWGRQTGGARKKRQHRRSAPPQNAPWKDRKWWRKERLDQAVLQLMTRCQQRFMWWGFDDIRSLSGGNITVFLHICHRIWDSFLKNESSRPLDKRTDLLKGGTIDRNIQAAGILFASNEWFNKLPEEPGGNARQSFVQCLGMRLNAEMMRDLRMAYPGGNGISIVADQFTSTAENITILRNFIREAVGYGALFETEHSSKTKADGKRLKFYLNPIFCPRFQLPEARTKEPYYWKLDDLFDLAESAQITLARGRVTRSRLVHDAPLLPGFETTKL